MKTDTSRSTVIAGAALAALAALSAPASSCAPSRPDLPAEETPDVEHDERIPDDARPVETETVLTEQNSGIEGSRRVAIRDEADWERFWSEVHDGRMPSPRAPEIDFGSDMVLAATMGRRSTGGYSIAIEPVLETGDRLYAVVRETSPGEGCMVTQALTAPATAVRVPRTEGEVTFVEREETRDC